MSSLDDLILTDSLGRSSEPSGSIYATIRDPGHRSRILAAACIALMAVIAAVTGLNVAQPHLALDFGLSQSQVLWVINIYAISLAALLLPLGAVGDRLGRKPVLLLGLAIFGSANIASGFASSLEIMLAARLMSGIGAAMIMPVTLSVMTSAFPDEERSKAIGIWTAVAGGGGILGMFLSALLVDFLSWRWLFALPIVLVGVAMVMAARSVPDTLQSFPHRFDSVGSILSALAIIGGSSALHEGPASGWASTETLTGIATGIGGLLAFILWELRHPAPLLDIRLFKKPNLTSGTISLTAWFGVQAGVFIVLYPFLQVVLGWSGLLATLGLMPMAALMMVFSGIAPKLSLLTSPKATIATGVLLGGSGLALMSLLVSVDGGYLSILPGMVAMGVGMGLAMAPSTEAITSSLSRENQGVASALNDVTRELGTSLGVALLGAVFAAGFSSTIQPQLSGVPDEVASLVQQNVAYAMTFARDGGPYADALYNVARESFVLAWQRAMWAGVALMSALFGFIVLRGPSSAHEGTPT